MSDRPEPIERQQFELAPLVKEHTPRWSDRNKQIVFAIARPAGSSPQGRLDYSRWAALPWPERIAPKSAVCRVEGCPGFYDYTRSSDRADAVEWHVLYGNVFARAAPEAVRRATTRIDPPTITNLIAMAAPAGGIGRYRTSDIEYVLVTAFTAFRAAVLESARSRGSDGPADKKD